jgi:MFS family permease
MFALTRDRRNVLVLATCQMLFGTGRSLIVSTAPLIAYAIATEKALATLPHALVIVGTAALTLPAALLMRRVGRKAGFAVGGVIGAVGGMVCVYAVFGSHFWWFCFGTFLFGSSAGFAQHYRFAVADVAAVDFRSTAISLVLAGGVVSGFAGPELAKFSKDLFVSTQFLGAYVCLIAMMAASAIVVMFVDIPPLTAREAAETQRPIGEIMRQPVFIVAVLAAAMGQGVMNLLMTATPLAMQHAHHAFNETAFVIEWHIVCMFAPGFVTGRLIRRWGEIAIILTGLALTAICVPIALAGTTVFLFWASMALLGIGWNFAFTGGTSLLNEAHSPAERAKVQGAVNFIIYGVAAVSALSAGPLLHFFSWEMVNLAALPMIAVSLLVTLYYAYRQRTAPH